jgi:hypothetical protein
VQQAGPKLASLYLVFYYFVNANGDDDENKPCGEDYEPFDNAPVVDHLRYNQRVHILYNQATKSVHGAGSEK